MADRVARICGCDEDVDVGSISNAGMRLAGCDEDLMSSIAYIGGQTRADFVHTMQTMQTFQTLQDHQK